MSTSVKFFHSQMPGAPVLSGSGAGSLIAVLDACLVAGFGGGTVDSVTIAGGVATVTRAAGHPFSEHTVALIAGATVSGGSINGEKRVLSATSTTYTFDATGVGDQTATGTITHKLAPAGWGSIGSGNVKAYQITDPNGTGCFLRVDDSAARVARVVGYRSMTDVNTGTGPFPTNDQVGGGAHWYRSYYNDGSACSWTLVADSRGFTIGVAGGWQNSGSGNGLYYSYHFGDFSSNKAPDPDACSLNGGVNDFSSSFGSDAELSLVRYITLMPHWVARGVSGQGNAVQVLRMAATPSSSNTSSMPSGSTSNGYPGYPNVADGGLLLAKIQLIETSPATVLRGSLAGIYFVPQAVGPAVFAQRQLTPGSGPLAGRQLMPMIVGPAGIFFLDATGPWRA